MRAPSPSATATPLDMPSSESMLRLVANAVPALLAYYELPTQRCVFANRGYAAASGFATPEAVLGKTVREVVGEGVWTVIEPHVQRAVRGETVSYTREQLEPNGEVRMLEVNLLPHTDPAVGRLGTFVMMLDITHHWLAERTVRQSEERMRKFSLATEEAIVFHREGKVVDFNEALTRLMGYTLDDARGRPILDFIAPSHRAGTEAYMREGREQPYEGLVLHKDGRPLTVEIVGKTMPAPDGSYRIAVIRDITARKQAQERVAFMAMHDALTHLPNRRHLMDQLAHTLELAQRRRGRAAVLCVDLDHFKTVNDSLGHQAGDLLLCEVARRLVAGVRTTDMVARVGADEFVVVLSDIHNRADAAVVSDKLVEAVRAVFYVEGTPLSMSPSVGISVFPEDGYAGDELVRRASAAMEQAKESGRGTRQFYAPGMDARASEVLQQEQMLRDAIAQNAFVLHYQPLVRVEDGELMGFEALVRWRHPERGIVGPNEFIGLAESRGLITPIGRWVMHEACRQMKAWQDEGLPKVPVAVNLSALEFRQRDVAGEIAAVLQKTGLAPQFLEIELTESVLMHQGDQVRATLDALRALGVGISIDDFGTGYSSLAYLKRYPIDKLKIDRSFVTDTPASADDVAIVTAIIQMSHSLQLQTVAEGVETPAQMALLRSLGCDLAQGYGISKPMDARQTRAWLHH